MKYGDAEYLAACDRIDRAIVERLNSITREIDRQRNRIDTLLRSTAHQERHDAYQTLYALIHAQSADQILVAQLVAPWFEVAR